eukprot:IDg1653t1
MRVGSSRLLSRVPPLHDLLPCFPLVPARPLHSSRAVGIWSGGRIHVSVSPIMSSSVVFHNLRIRSAFPLIPRTLYVAILIFWLRASVARVDGHFYHCTWFAGVWASSDVPFVSAISWVSGTN